MLILDGCSILFKAGIYFLGKVKDQIKQVKEFRKSFLCFDMKQLPCSCAFFKYFSNKSTKMKNI